MDQALEIQKEKDNESLSSWAYTASKRLCHTYNIPDTGLVPYVKDFI